MRVLVAGGSGAIGTQLVPLLLDDGHDVTIMARNPGRAHGLVAAGAHFVEADALDAEAVTAAVTTAHPDVIVNLLTAIPQTLRPKRFQSQMEATNLLRVHGTRHLIDAGNAAGTPKLVSESIAFLYDPTSREPATESDAPWANPPRSFRAALDAVLALERMTLDVNGIVLRFGHLYGSGTGFASDGAVFEAIAAGKLPVVADGGSMFSFIHVADAAKAVRAAITYEGSGIFNIVDDEPVPTGTWLPGLAKMLGAKTPKRAPAFVAKMFAGDWGVAYMTELRGASNRRAAEVLGWRPRYKAWSEGFTATLREETATSAA